MRVLQNDLAVMRAELAEADTMRRAHFDSVVALLDRLDDSVRAVSSRFAKFQGDTRGEMYALGQQLIQIQELTGQSQRRLQELRGSLEQRQQALAAAPMTDTTQAAGVASPGPNQLYQLAVEQLRRGSSGAARVALQDLLRQYPNADIAGDAMFFIAESYAAEANPTSADSVYAVVVERYPQSPRAATAMYKRALLTRDAGNTALARTMLEQLVQRFPRSDEAVLARDLLRTLR